MSDSVRPHRRQPTRLPRPWDFPVKNTGVGCHFLLQCMKVKSESEVVQLCPTLRDPMDCSLTGSSIHGIFQARGLEWGAIAFSEALTCSCPQHPHSAYFLVLFPSFGKYQVVFSAAADVRVHPKMKKAKICGCHMAGELGRGG